MDESYSPRLPGQPPLWKRPGFEQTNAMVNLRSLRYFLKVTEYGSITRAAVGLHITQPSLTQHLRHLEEYFGARLFMRHGRGVVLTEAGRLLRVKGEILIEEIEGLRSEVEGTLAVPRGTLAIGMPISWSRLVTYPVVARYRREYPDVRIKLVVHASQALATAMHNDEIQLAVLTETDDLSAFSTRPVVEDGVFLVGPASSGLSGRASLSLTELTEYPLILPLNMTLVMRRIERALAASGLSMKSVIETESTNILSLIELGLGFAPLSAAALPPMGAGSPFAAAQIADMAMGWTIATPKNRPISAAVIAFEKFLLERIEKCISGGKWRTGKIVPELVDVAKAPVVDSDAKIRL